MPIETPQDLREHLQVAISVELSTVPPYLYAMYSIEDQKSEAALLIRSIAAEEMLHAVLASNLLLAVGGEPKFATTELMPTYPGALPHHRPPLILNLEPCSLRLVRETLLVIEQPELEGAAPEADEFETLGQFYNALEVAFEELAATHDLFADPQPLRQLSDPTFYAPVEFDAEDSGGLSLVDSLATAREAIEVIIHQGEGLGSEKWADPAHQELTHYYKLLQIADGTSPLGAVRPVAVNPKTSDYPPALQPVSDLFNAVYRYLYLTLDALFQPSDDKSGLVGRLYRVMSSCLSPVAGYLMTQPVADGRMAGPTFEVYDFGDDRPEDHLARLAERVIGSHPELEPVGTTLSTL